MVIETVVKMFRKWKDGFFYMMIPATWFEVWPPFIVEIARVTVIILLDWIVTNMLFQVIKKRTGEDWKKTGNQQFVK